MKQSFQVINDAKFQFVEVPGYNSTQKFANAKTYFAYQFNQSLGKDISINLNNHKSELAAILKDNLPSEFENLLNFLLKNLSPDLA